MSRWHTKLGIVAFLLVFALGTPVAFAWEEVPPGPTAGAEDPHLPGDDTDPDDFPIIMNEQNSEREEIGAPTIGRGLLSLRLMAYLTRFLSI